MVIMSPRSTYQKSTSENHNFLVNIDKAKIRTIQAVLGLELCHGKMGIMPHIVHVCHKAGFTTCGLFLIDLSCIF